MLNRSRGSNGQTVKQMRQLSDKAVPDQVLEIDAEETYTEIALEFSAHSSMWRTFLIIFVLVALCGSAANGLPKHPAKSKGSTASATASHPLATASHKKSRHAEAQTVERASGHESRRESRHETRRASSRTRAENNEDVRPALVRRSSRSHQAAEPSPVLKSHSSRRSHRDEENRAVERPAVVENASLSRTRLVMPPPLRGSMESLVRQNQRTEADGLERIQDDDDLIDRIIRGMLVPVPASVALTVNGNLPVNRRYCRPWTATFLSDLAHAHAAQFHSPIEVSSAVRTVAYQKQLMKTNGNATAAEGDVASPHLTGATIDIAKQGMSLREIAWMRIWLLQLENAGKIDVEEEFQQSCFHITVYKSYVLPNPARKPTVQAGAAPAKTVQG
jgi:hypothetical protein